LNASHGWLALLDRVKEKQKQISDQRVALQSAQANRDRLHRDREQFQKFHELRNEAQLYAANLTGLDAAEHQKALRTKALAALAVMVGILRRPRPSGAWSSRSLTRLTPKKKTRSWATATTCS